MDIKTYLVILLMLFLANLPFINERLFFVFQISSIKNIKIILVEWIVNFIIFFSISFALEGLNANIYHQGKRFYVVLLCLYIVFSFPGFVLKYFWNTSNKGISKK